MPEPEDDWLDEQLLAQELPSTRNWQKAARGGITTAEAISRLPTWGQFQVRMPIAVHRAIRRYLRERNESVATFIRGAIERELRARGHWDDDEYGALHG